VLGEGLGLADGDALADGLRLADGDKLCDATYSPRLTPTVPVQIVLGTLTARYHLDVCGWYLVS